MYRDQIGNFHSFSAVPKKIISVVPSQTELLAYLKLDKEVIGITKFCTHPRDWFKTKNKIGGTKNLNIRKILDLQPDLIIANKEENDKKQIESLQQSIPVWVSDIKNLEDALSMIKNVGLILNKENAAIDLIQKIKQAKQNYRLNTQPILSATYLIWDKPIMAAGRNTFIHHMMKLAGFKNVFSDQKRYPTIDSLDLIQASPKVILLSSEPFPFKAKHIIKYQNILPNAKILLVDGTMFSWYGSRLVKAFTYFSQLKR